MRPVTPPRPRGRPRSVTTAVYGEERSRAPPGIGSHITAVVRQIPFDITEREEPAATTTPILTTLPTLPEGTCGTSLEEHLAFLELLPMILILIHTNGI